MSAELDKDVAEFWALLFEIVLDAEKRLAQHMAMHDLTPPQFFVLKTLVEHGGRCPIGKIAQAHHLTNATMTGLVNRLESGTPPLVGREKSLTDGRSVDVFLTDAGQARFFGIMQELQEQAQSFLQFLGEEERKELLAKIRTYYDLVIHQFPLSS